VRESVQIKSLRSGVVNYPKRRKSFESYGNSSIKEWLAQYAEEAD